MIWGLTPAARRDRDLSDAENRSNLWPSDVDVKGHVVVTGVDLGFATRRRQTPQAIGAAVLGIRAVVRK